ncbi:MAG: UDP-N-acetylmuramoyl-L-alanine--D-glutamate ligase [Candidatus Komeilibacteria bacterium]|nr:UDP-N-acetylmuramoyl-L-alanine--D-glutamate ligase [Candidatus Komeilibacteria bacterium]
MAPKDWQGKKFLIMGLGLNSGGLGVALWLQKHGHDFRITDLKTTEQLKPSLTRLRVKKNQLVLGRHRAMDFKWADIVIANPIVRPDNKFLKIARQRGAAIYNDASFFLRNCPAEVIGITGTKGKSTTAFFIYQLLRKKYCTFLGGNIGISPFEFLDKLRSTDKVVLELSSWQCEGLAMIKQSPAVGVLTNLGKDHLNTYKSVHDYHGAKLLLFKYQSARGRAVLNKDDEVIKKKAPKIASPIKWYGLRGKSGAVRGKTIFYRDKKIADTDDLRFKGQHNQRNLMAALTVADIYNLSQVTIKKELPGLTTPPGRFELIRLKAGVRYINDTTATAPVATMEALKTITTPLILIAGGADKKLEFQEMAHLIAQKTEAVVLLKGEGSVRIKNLLKKEGYDKFTFADSMPQAVRQAYALAEAGSTVLLSPGTSSFGMFINEFDRGAQFTRAVKSL